MIYPVIRIFFSSFLDTFKSKLGVKFTEWDVLSKLSSKAYADRPFAHILKCTILGDQYTGISTLLPTAQTKT